MSFRRCFFKCESSASLYGLPKNECVRNKWLLFIFQAVPEQYSPHTFLCSRHFTEDCFGNWAQFRSGFAKKLTLIEGSVPTLFNVRVVPASPRPRPSTSHISNSSRTNSVSRVRSLGCQTEYTLQLSRLTQTDPPKRRGVATQLSWGTLRNWHMRSKGTQTPHLSTSTLDMDSRPSKRPNIEVKAEVEEVEIGDEGAEEEEGEGVEVEEEEFEYEEGGTWTEPLDSPASQGDTNVDKFEIEIEPQSTYRDTKYIVSDSCLMELFEICPVCKGQCAVERRRVDLIVAFKQICPSCSYSRVWQNQHSAGAPPVGNIQHSVDTYYTDTSVIKTEEDSC